MLMVCFVFFFKQKTAYDLRISDWSSDVCSSDLFLACSRNGYVCTPSLHKNHTVGEIVTLMERCAAKAIVFEPGYGGDAAQLDFVTATQALPKMQRLYALPKAGDAVPTGDRQRVGAGRSGSVRGGVGGRRII